MGNPVEVNEMPLDKQINTCRPMESDELPDCGGESRSEPRVRVHKMVRVRLVAEAGMAAVSSPPFTACMTEVSPAGVSLLAGRAIQVGAQFQLTVRDAEGPVTDLLYRAVRCEHVARGHYQVGAELVRVLRPRVGAAAMAPPAADVRRIVASSRLAG